MILLFIDILYRVYLVEREKVERKVDFLEKKLVNVNRFIFCMNIKG